MRKMELTKIFWIIACCFQLFAIFVLYVENERLGKENEELREQLGQEQEESGEDSDNDSFFNGFR